MMTAIGAPGAPDTTALPAAIHVPGPTVRDTPYRGAWERAYIAWETGEGMQDSGQRFGVPPRASLAALLAAIPVDVRAVYLVGALPGLGSVKVNGGGSVNAFLAWAMSDPGADWQNSGDRLGGSYYHRTAPASTVLRLRRASDGRQLDMRPFHCWGTDGASPDVARAALRLLEDALHDSTHGGWFGTELGCSCTAVLASPAVTGELLWQRCISPGIAWPILPDELRAVLHSTSGQQRIETFPAPAGVDRLPALYALDGRFAYADMLFGLGYGPAEHDEVPAFAPRREGWYRVTATIPDDWPHVGLLPLKHAGDGTSWEYPSEPGRRFTTWAGTAELRRCWWPMPHVCRHCAAGWQRLQPGTVRRSAAPPCPEHGWHIRIHERLLFQTSDAPRGHLHPLDVFATRLRIIYDQLKAIETPEAQVAAKAVRMIVLDTIGMFHRGSRRRTYSAPLCSAGVPAGVPLEVVTLRDANGVATEDVALWEVPEPMPADAMSHPELSVQIYSRTRARMALGWQGDGQGGAVPTGMLTVPREQLVAVRGDALYLTSDPQWPDDGRPGTLRLKACIPGPLPWPASNTKREAV